MDPGQLIGLLSLLFTAVGSVAAVLAVRPRRIAPPGTGRVEARSALLLLGSSKTSRATARVLRILSRYIFVSHTGRVAFGTLDQMVSSVFLDLFSACTFPKCRAPVAQLIVSCIRGWDDDDRPDVVAVPKEGNVLLAAEVARRLRAGLVMIRTMVPAIRFGDPIEGSLPGGATVVLVDDIAADGEMLVRAVATVRQHGGRISRCICAIERLDGNTRESLGACDVSLFAPIELEEETLRKLAKLPATTKEVAACDEQSEPSSS